MFLSHQKAAKTKVVLSSNFRSSFEHYARSIASKNAHIQSFQISKSLSLPALLLSMINETNIAQHKW